MIRAWAWGWALGGALLAAAAAAATAPTPAVSVIAPLTPGTPSAYGAECIVAALRSRGVAVERVDSPAQARGDALIVLLPPGSGESPRDPESLVIRRSTAGGKPQWTLTGADERGLMYAALDVAERIEWASDPANPLGDLRETTERPALATRAISLYTFQRAYWESRFHDAAYWDRYFDLMARNRFNMLVLVFGYENGGYFAPCYPYFFDVEGFPDVRVVGQSAEEQARNRASLERLLAQAHAHGIAVKIGIWDHIYRGGVQAGGIPGAEEAVGRPTEGLVWGVTAENLNAYTRAALREFLRRFPEVDAIQFRMHWESGLQRREQEAFWREMFERIREEAPQVDLDLRAKDLPDSVIQSAIDVGVRFRISTKWWMEQLGLPFHPTHINRQDQSNRRHSYADLLRYPRRYPIHWQVFSGGTQRVLLWGDPEFARRFALENRLYEGDGFEINEPLCTKMAGQPHDTPPFALLQDPYRFYDYEFERYWAFFRAFGRMGYNPQTPPEVWTKPFERRFGPEAGPLIDRALRRASWVTPMIVGAAFTYREFAMTYGWPEKHRFWDLPYFARAQGSDIELFESFDEEAQRLLDGGRTAKVRPQETARWFEQTAEAILADVAQAERRIGDRRGREFETTVTDLRILAHLARYHARRIPAAVQYRLFERTRDPAALRQALAHEREAVEAWRALVEAAGDVYSADLMMGARSRDLCGHWRDELAALEAGVRELEARLAQADPAATRRPAPPLPPAYEEGWAASVQHDPPSSHPAGTLLRLAVRAQSPAGVERVNVRFRPVNQTMDYETLEMVRVGESDRFEAVVPAERIDPAWDFMYFFEVYDGQGRGTHWPPFLQTTPYYIIPLTRP